MISTLLRRLAATAILATSAAGYCEAAVVSPYTMDFSKEIDVSDHAFKAASNWGHIVGSYADWYDTYYMTYVYEGTAGVNGTSCLHAKKQEAGDGWDTQSVTDCLVTPPVKGDVKIKVKREDTYSSTYIKIYNVNADGSLGTLIQSVMNGNIGESTDEWYEIEIASGVEDFKRFALQCQLVYIDDFSATAADIIPEAHLKISSVTPSNESNFRLDQQPDGTIKAEYKVTVTNTGEVPLTAGMENYSITAVNASKSPAVELFTVAVPQNLAVGETSAEFTVAGNIDASQWSYSTAYISLKLRENISGSEVLPNVYTYYNSYEPKFVFRGEGESRTSSISNDISFGFITESASLSYEIYNDGRAPLTVKSVTLPEGFTSTAPAGEFTVDALDKVPVTITLGADEPGLFKGELAIVYVDASGSDRTYTVGLQGNVIDADTWICDFGSEAITYPAGSIANTGINSESSYSDYCIYGSTYNADFITPLLHADAGEAMIFSAASKSYSSYSPATVKVYLSKDRIDWGEPVLTLQSELTSQWITSQFEITEAGDYYVKFEIPNAKLDNLCGFTKVDKAYDLFVKDINCPAKVKSGDKVTFKASVMAPLAIAADAYTMTLMNGETAVAQFETLAFAANAKNSTEMSVEFTPVVEKTSTWQLYAKVSIKDGTEIRSGVHELLIENQPDFVFFDAGSPVSDAYKPSNRSAAIDFGRTNTLGASMEFEIYNWGSAPLTVSSISVPEGFSTNITEASVASKERKPLTVTLSTETPGSYSGNLTIIYKDVTDADCTFELPVSATLLDPSKWHLAFTGEGTSTLSWPLGTLHAKNVRGNQASYPDYTWYVTSASTTDNMFITPKLKASEGETIEITAKQGSRWSNPQGKIYAAPTREALLADASTDPELAAERRLLGTLSNSFGDEYITVSEEWQNFQVAIDQAGEFYLGIEISGSLWVSEFYGFTLDAVEHELVFKGQSIPEHAMQNVATAMSINVHNYGMAAESADSYTLTAIVNGEEIPVASTVDIPVNLSLDDAATSIPMAVRYHTPGTFPVQLRLATATQTFTTETKDVTFAQEVASSEKQVGEVSSISGQLPLRFNDKNSESVMLYTAADLGLNDGDRIGAIVFKGYNSPSTYKNKTFKVKAYYEWTDDQTQADPGSGMYDVSGMTCVINDSEPRTWEAMGSNTEPADLITLSFDEPLVYEAGKSLRLVMSHLDAVDYFSDFGFERTGSLSAYYHSNDSKSSFESNSWNRSQLPVIHLSLVVEPSTVKGQVTDLGDAVAGAVVTLNSTDGDNVRYTATTDAEGNYSLDVIQNQRSYDVTVEANGKEDFAEDCVFAGNSTLDFSLADVAVIDNTVDAEHSDLRNAIVKFKLNIGAGMTAVVLPVDLTADEVAALFGDAVEVSAFSSSTVNAGNLHLVFETVGADDNGTIIKAGKPYLLDVKSAASAIRLRGKDVKGDITPDSDSNAEINGTYSAIDKSQGMYLLEEGTFVASDPRARTGAKVAPYSAYVKALDPSITSISYSVGTSTGVEVIEAEDAETETVIYNLQGIRVDNPQPGIYIVNGKKVYIK